VSLACAVALLIQMMLESEVHTLFADRETATESQENVYGLWPTLAWFAFLLALTAVVGFILALGLFLLSFLRIRAQLTWLTSLLYTGSGIVFMCLMAWLLNRDFPPGLLQKIVDLPWPLG
jgi:ABC-type sulfate transport system permease component